jgi:putative flippase GtrA
VSQLSVTQGNKFRDKLTQYYHDPITRNQFIKFIGIGVTNVIVGYGSFYILVNFLNYQVALLCAHLIGVTNSFFWNKLWVFKTKNISIMEFLRFNVVYSFVYITNAVALYISVEILKIDPRPAQLILLPIVTLISFFGQKLWTFKVKKVGGEL